MQYLLLKLDLDADLTTGKQLILREEEKTNRSKIHGEFPFLILSPSICSNSLDLIMRKLNLFFAYFSDAAETSSPGRSSRLLFMVGDHLVGIQQVRERCNVPKHGLFQNGFFWIFYVNTVESLVAICLLV